MGLCLEIIFKKDLCLEFQMDDDLLIPVEWAGYFNGVCTGQYNIKDESWALIGYYILNLSLLILVWAPGPTLLLAALLFLYGKIGKLIPQLSPKGQVHPRTFKRINIVPQLMFLSQMHPLCWCGVAWWHATYLKSLFYPCLLHNNRWDYSN
jgi:hypothetical protein